MLAIDFRTDVAEPSTPPTAPGPQARHRPLTQDDYVHGCDTRIERRTRLYTNRWGPPLACPPKLPTIYEKPKLRCPRRELDDPDPASPYKFSAIFCPRVYGRSIHMGMPFVTQDEHLENFVVLTKWRGYFVNVSMTLDARRIRELRSYAHELFREAFANGQLR